MATGGVSVLADTYRTQLEAVYNDIKVVINGKPITPTATRLSLLSRTVQHICPSEPFPTLWDKAWIGTVTQVPSISAVKRKAVRLICQPLMNLKVIALEPASIQCLLNTNNSKIIQPKRTLKSASFCIQFLLTFITISVYFKLMSRHSKIIYMR